MATKFPDMESALKTYFENQNKPDTPQSFTEVGNKIMNEFVKAIEDAEDSAGNGITSTAACSGIGPAFTAEFIAQFGGAQPNFGPVTAAVTAGIAGLVLQFTKPNAVSLPSPGMNSTPTTFPAMANVMTSGGVPDKAKYKKAFEMKDDMTAAKTAQRITDAMKSHFNGNTTLLTGAIIAPPASPITVTAISKLSQILCQL